MHVCQGGKKVCWHGGDVRFVSRTSRWLVTQQVAQVIDGSTLSHDSAYSSSVVAKGCGDHLAEHFYCRLALRHEC